MIPENHPPERIHATEAASTTRGRPVSCPQCGRPVEDDAPRRLCLRCLTRMLAAPPEQEATATLALPRPFGNYELLAEIGRGGMGVVYRARDLSLGRSVAIKILPGALFGNPQFVLRFREEARATATLRHPNIVAIFNVGEYDGQSFFAMEYIEGETLAARVAQTRPPAREAAALLRTLAETVQFAHDRGILHRDLKPSNILLDEAGQPRIADFGLAKRLAEVTELTLTGQTLGSPNYIPPEQVTVGRGEIGPASDVYALGAVLYHLLTGRPPLMADTVHDTLEAVLHRDPVAPRQLNPTVPRDLETICLKCLAKEPRRRYPTARELADDLNRFLQQHPIQARPTTSVERMAKWMRRHPARASSVVMVLACLTVIGLLAIRHNAQLRHQRDRALASERAAEQAVTQLAFNAALGQFAKDRCLPGLRQLAHLLRREPEHAAAARRLASALTYRAFNLLAFTPLAAQSEVRDAHFTPNGQWIVTGAADGTVQFWDAQTGRAVAPPIQRPDAVVVARPGPKGRRLLVAEANGTLSFWSLETGRQIGNAITNGVPVLFARISPDDELALAAFADRTVRVWRIASGQPVRPPIPHHDLVTVAEFNPAGDTLLTGSREGHLLSWSLRNGQPVGAVVDTFRPLRGAAFNPDGSRFATASGDPSALIWESASGRVLKRLTTRAAAHTAVAFSPDGYRLASGTLDGTWIVSDAVGRQRLSDIVDAPGSITSLAFSPEGERVLVVTSDQSVQLFDSQSGAVLSEPIPHGHPVRSAEFSPDGIRILTAAGSNVCVWEVVRVLKPPLIIPCASRMHRICYSPSGKKLLVTGADGAARLFDARRGEALGVPMRHLADIPLPSARFSTDGSKVATASADHTARVWDGETGQPLSPWLQHQDIVFSAEFDAAGRRLITASADNTAILWDLDRGTNVLPPLSHPDDVLWAAFAPGEARLLTTCRDGRVRWWDASTGTLLAVDPARGGAILRAGFSPNGEWLLTGAEDGTVTLAASDFTRTSRLSYKHAAPVADVAFSPDGAQFLSAAADGAMQMGLVASNEILAQIAFKRTLTRIAFKADSWSGLAVVNREFVAPWNREAGPANGGGIGGRSTILR